MATEVTDIISLAAFATSFLAYLEARKANRTNEAFSALSEVIEASEKTQTYFQKLEGGEERDMGNEYSLAELWEKAAFSVSRIDKSLAVRLSAKSKFWRNRDTWDSDFRASKDISLEGVTNSAKSLMERYA